MRRRNLVSFGLLLATIAVPLPVGSGQAREPFLAYTIGGFAPAQHLQISALGYCTLQYSAPRSAGTKVRHFVLRPRHLDALKSALAATRWTSLRTRYDVPPSPGQESVFYSVTHAGRTVTTNSVAREQKSVPARLLRLLDLLDRILAAHL